MAGILVCNKPSPLNSSGGEDYNSSVGGKSVSSIDEETTQLKVNEILKSGESYKNAGQSEELAELIRISRPFISSLSKAKAGKLVRSLVDLFLDLKTDTSLKVYLCKECIEWSLKEKHMFLRQTLEVRLLALYYDSEMYAEALSSGAQILKELKKLDDKHLLVEVQLIESKTYHALCNMGKAKAALTSARATANAIYCPPKMQASLDMQSGILYAAEERDFKTSYSYFYESFEGFSGTDDSNALIALKYMLLCKIILGQSDDVNSILSNKLAVLFKNTKDIEAMKAIARASQKRSLADFQDTLVVYKQELDEDAVIKSHLGKLYDTMLEQNLLRIIEPYSRHELSVIANSIKLPLKFVESKLSQMILDKKFAGILDQGAGVVIVFDEMPEDKIYDTTLEMLHNIGKVIDSLYKKAKNL